MRIIRVDMTEKKTRMEDIPEGFTGLGGRGLCSILINSEVPADCDPLGTGNKLIVAPGILAGTSLVNTCRISVGAKSPLTRTIKESNAGGTIGSLLGQMELTLVLEGSDQAGGLFLLKIDGQGRPSLIPANGYQGLRTYALAEKISREFGPGVSFLGIGPAGELQLLSASIQSSDTEGRPCRAAGRGGLGAVMGSKGIKAILVERPGRDLPAWKETEAFKTAAKTFARGLREHPFTGRMLPSLGTAGLVGPVNSLGAFPSYNATRGQMDNWERISGEKLAETIKERGGVTTHGGCSRCVINCSNVYHDEQGAYLTGSLEYETIWSMGGMTGIDDLDCLARLDFLCDDIGLDTMNTGVALAVAMDAGHIPFGDQQAVLDLLEETAGGNGLGRVIGNGPAAVGDFLGHDRVPVVKNQSIAAYDPRAMQGNGVTYATSTMGADHTAGNLLGNYLSKKMDPLAAKGQMEASRQAQITMAFLDSTGLCLLAGAMLSQPETLDAFLSMLSIRLGREFGQKDMQELGIRVLQAERNFNQKAGFSSKDDRLPVFFKEEALPPHDTVFMVPDQDLERVFDFTNQDPKH
ncbi:MAG: aldehyde ferredoxin oxidoreductase [Desulfohalobiaceae bacterium]|nr:aldehyde ferredoxin oxidoreductase [Desulfohalobiaceae bacterium]